VGAIGGENQFGEKGERVDYACCVGRIVRWWCLKRVWVYDFSGFSGGFVWRRSEASVVELGLSAMFKWLLDEAQNNFADPSATHPCQVLVDRH